MYSGKYKGVSIKYYFCIFARGVRARGLGLAQLLAARGRSAFGPGANFSPRPQFQSLANEEQIDWKIYNLFYTSKTIKKGIGQTFKNQI